MLTCAMLACEDPCHSRGWFVLGVRVFRCCTWRMLPSWQPGRVAPSPAASEMTQWPCFLAQMVSKCLWFGPSTLLWPCFLLGARRTGMMLFSGFQGYFGVWSTIVCVRSMWDLCVCLTCDACQAYTCGPQTLQAVTHPTDICRYVLCLTSWLFSDLHSTCIPSIWICLLSCIRCLCLFVCFHVSD